MANNCIDDFFCDSYGGEFERKDKHDAADNFLLAIVSVLGSIAFFSVRLLPFEESLFLIPNFLVSLAAGFNFTRNDQGAVKKIHYGLLVFFAFAPGFIFYWFLTHGASFSLPKMIFVGCFGAFTGFFVAAVFSIVGSVLPRDIQLLAPAKEWDDYLSNLRVFYGYGDQDLEAFEAAAEGEFRRVIRSRYVVAATANRQSNLIKQKWQTRARYFVAFAAFATMVNAIPCYNLLHFKTPDVQDVKIVEIPRGDNNDRSTTTTTSQATPSTSSEPGKKAGSTQERDSARGPGSQDQ